METEGIEATVATVEGEGDLTQEWTYVGVRGYYDNQNKYHLWYEWRRLDGPEGERSMWSFDKQPKGVSPAVGSIYLWCYSTPKRDRVWTSGPRGPRYQRRWANEAEVAAWQALHDQALHDAKRAKLEAEEKSDEVQQAMSALYRAAAVTDQAGRRALADLVMLRLLRYVPTAEEREAAKSGDNWRWAAAFKARLGRTR